MYFEAIADGYEVTFVVEPYRGVRVNDGARRYVIAADGRTVRVDPFVAER